MTVRLRDRLPEVTPRQHEVARLVARGLTNPQIAEELGITLDGAKYHVAELLNRLELYSRAEIAEWYREAERRRRLQRARLLLLPLVWTLAGLSVVAALLLALLAARGVWELPGAASSAAPQQQGIGEDGPSAVLDTIFTSQGDLWSRAFVGPTTALEAPVLAAADDGGVFIGATFGTEGSAESIDLGGGELISAGAWDGVIARLAPNGDHVWSRRFGGAGMDGVADITADREGGLVGIGGYTGSVDLGTGPLADGLAARTTWLALFDHDGGTMWSRTLARGEVQATTVTMIGDDIVVAGAFEGTTEIGGSSVTASGASDLFVAAFDGEGALEWLRTIDLDGREQRVAATSADGQVVLAATVSRATDAGEPETTEADLVLIAFEPGGDERWRQVFGGAGLTIVAAGIAGSGDGSVVVAASLTGQVNLGGDWLESAGSGTRDVVLARFAADGRHLWSQRFGSEHDAIALGLATDGDAIYVSGIFRERVDIGGVPLESSLNADGRPAQSAFLAQLDIDGARISSRAFGEPRSARDQDLLVGAHGDLYASGLFLGLVDVGSGRLMSMQAFLDAFIAKVAP